MMFISYFLRLHTKIINRIDSLKYIVNLNQVFFFFEDLT